MKALGGTSLVLLTLVLRAAPAAAEVPAAATTTNTAPPAIETNAAAWSLSAYVYGYIVPDSRDYLQPTATADYGWLHLEARYNYEALDTTSLWLGYNVSGEKPLAWELTPMLGGAFGEMDGIAPGYRASLSWWRLQLDSEGEYYFDARNSSVSFFYNWSELALAPLDWFRIGAVTQRTRAYASDRDIQRGLLIGFSYKPVSFTAYVLNPDEARPTVVLAAGVTF